LLKITSVATNINQTVEPFINIYYDVESKLIINKYFLEREQTSSNSKSTTFIFLKCYSLFLSEVLDQSLNILNNQQESYVNGVIKTNESAFHSNIFKHVQFYNQQNNLNFQLTANDI